MPEHPPSAPRPRAEHRASPVWSFAGTILRIGVLALAVFLVARLASSVSWVDLRDRLAPASPTLLTAAFVALIGRFAAWQHRWSVALRRIGEPRGLRVRFAALTASILINHVTPTVRLLGGIVRARYLAARQDYGFARVYGAVLFDQFVHHVVSGLFTWIALIGFTWYLGRTTLTWIAVSAAPLLAAYLFWRSRSGEPSPQRRLARALTRRIRQRSQRFDLFLNRGRETVAILTDLLKDRPVIVQGAFWTAVVFALNFSAQALLFAAIDAHVEPIAVFAVVALGSFAGALAGTPGGIGSTEAAMIAGYAALGIESADAVTAVLAFRGFHYISVIVTGLPSLIWLSTIRRGGTPIIGR